VITDNSGNVVERNDYYPFGGKHANSSYAQLSANKQKFNGKELQTTGNTGFLDYGARMYDPTLGRWHVLDPLAEDFPSLTPYHFVHNNPIIMTDPTGMAASPIYDEEGKFLGTDNQGLQGDAIVMNKDNFKQGMSHEEAKKNDLGTDGLKSVEAKSNQFNHYQGLKDRPDYDGFVTILEGVDWAKKNPGALKNPTPDNTLYLDASKLDFGNISTSNFQNINETTPVNLLNPGNLASSTCNSRLRATVYALGRVDMQLKNRSLGTVSIVNNRATDYDWNTGGGQLRSTLINAERLRTGIGDNHGFRTYYYGYGKLNK
jgi:RHS repeat-associated protein